MPAGFNMQAEDAAVPKPRQGILVSRRAAVGIALIAVATLVLTAVLVHHLSVSSSLCDGLDRDDLFNEFGPSEASRLDVRLPRNVLPERYEIRLIPYLWPNGSNATFSGSIRILLNITENTSRITLHIHQLNIKESESHVRGVSIPGDVAVIGHDRDEARQFLIVRLGQTLQAGKQYELQLVFTGELNDQLQGFYRSSYVENNETRWIATTQFQPTDARRAFPCFDEPAMKARFRISLAHPQEMKAISNMPANVSRQSPDTESLPSGYKWTHFSESVPMSTYLVAFVVSPFSMKRSTQPGSTFSVWARRDALDQAEYALSVGPLILKYFEKYFGLQFPLPKIDMVALPDFAAGAMENWGLITYRETTMLYEANVSTSSNKQRVAVVVSHELAHQWFGNLVTPAWWSDLWLNEGFASYVEYLGVNAVEPEWQVMEQFVVDEVQSVFALDALRSSHPISVVVGHPDEINEIFDRISYSKGASIIRMMDHFLTSAVFTRGLNNYLKSKAYKSATQADLWSALTAQAHKDGALAMDLDVATIMDSWTLQTGFPVVTVTRDYAAGTATITQERFLLNPDNSTLNTQLWWVPITYTTSAEKDFNTTKPKLWLRGERSAVISELPRGEKPWLQLNVQETGFYRVNYDARNWALLTEMLNQEDLELPAVTRAQLLDDALALARSGRLSYETALDVTRYLKRETEYLPWKAALTSLSYIDTMLIKTAAFADFKTYMMQQLGKVYNTTGLEERPDEGELVTLTRVHVLSWMCSLGHEECIKYCVDMFARWRQQADPDTNNPIPPNLKNVVYCTAIKHGGQKEWDFAWQRYRSTNVGSEKELVLSALGCTRETWILSRYLLLAVTENSGIRKQDAARVFSAVSGNVIGQPLAFAFLRDQWERIREHLGSSLFSVSSMVRSATRRLHSPRELDELRLFANSRRGELGQAKRAVQQSIERTQANVQWMQKNGAVIEKWLARAVQSS